MTGPRISLVLLGVVALAACSSGGGSSKSTTTNSSVFTVSSAPAAAATSTTAGSADTTTTTPLPGQTGTNATGGATTTAAARVVTKPSDNVHLGDTGSGVKQIQTALVAHGYKVAVDSRFGPLTAQAVKDFQKKSGLTQDGVVGPVTWAKLQAAPAATTTVKATTTTAKA